MRIGPSPRKRKRIVVADVVIASDAVVAAHVGVVACHPVSASAPTAVQEETVDAPSARSPLLRKVSDSLVFPPFHSIP